MLKGAALSNSTLMGHHDNVGTIVLIGINLSIVLGGVGFWCGYYYSARHQALSNGWIRDTVVSVPPIILQYVRRQVRGLLRFTETTSSNIPPTTTKALPLPQSLSLSPSSSSNNSNNSNRNNNNNNNNNQENDAKLIHEVLMYWFGQYAPEGSQKKLWMIASSSVQHRRQIDQEITIKFHKLLRQLVSNTNDQRDRWCCQTQTSTEHQGKIATIIVLDQFSRHIHRYYKDQQQQQQQQQQQNPIDKPPQQSICDQIAFQIAQIFQTDHAQQLKCGMIPLPMAIFALMPYRHQQDIPKQHYVQNQIAVLDQLEQTQMLQRFRKATNRRMAVLQDEQRRMGSGYSAGSSDKKQTNQNNKTLIFDDADILEVFPFDADMTSAPNHIISKTIMNFLSNHSIHKNIPVIVSLSGGVDSMVVLNVLANVLKQTRVYAIHIDYANRPESGAEARFVESYSRQLGVRFRLRRIGEVTRGVTARDDYERIARETRYSVYRQIVKEARDSMEEEDGTTATLQISDTKIGVMLGHHRGDLRENVLSNAHKGCGPLDLSGMTETSMNDGVLILRPLLPLEKTAVYDYAHTFGVPYFKDTTPHWSTRGKLRNKLLPLLEEIYGEGSMGNLSTLAKESDEARKLLHNAILAPFLNQVVRKPMGIMFDTDPWKQQGLFFWKFVLREALHGAGLGMFSDKSVVAFLARIQTKKLREGWLQCRRDYAVYLRLDGRVFVFFPQSFPFRKADQFDCIGQKLSIGDTARVGPWLIETTIAATANNNGNQRAYSDMEEFMSGSLQYYVVNVPKKATHQLEFVSVYSKATRPPGWRGSDMKIQATLPLLARSSEDSSTNTSESIAAMVSMHLDNI